MEVLGPAESPGLAEYQGKRGPAEHLAFLGLRAPRESRGLVAPVGFQMMAVRAPAEPRGLAAHLGHRGNLAVAVHPGEAEALGHQAVVGFQMTDLPVLAVRQGLPESAAAVVRAGQMAVLERPGETGLAVVLALAVAAVPAVHLVRSIRGRENGIQVLHITRTTALGMTVQVIFALLKPLGMNHQI